MDALETYCKKVIPAGELIADDVLAQVMEEMADAFEEDFSMRPTRIAAYDDGKSLHFLGLFPKLDVAQAAEFADGFEIMALAAVSDVEGFSSQHEQLGDHTIIHLSSVE